MIFAAGAGSMYRNRRRRMRRGRLRSNYSHNNRSGLRGRGQNPSINIQDPDLLFRYYTSKCPTLQRNIVPLRWNYELNDFSSIPSVLPFQYNFMPTEDLRNLIEVLKGSQYYDAWKPKQQIECKNPTNFPTLYLLIVPLLYSPFHNYGLLFE